ncbi:hypothetical protein GCM10010307_81860 [Streptomyces vastus]|uniref:Uncharacterized protein n=1 Tax=Streptomyces vastus TaxID=285451 RepID=A0ABP6ED04_9ACTN
MRWPRTAPMQRTLTRAGPVSAVPARHPIRACGLSRGLSETLRQEVDDKRNLRFALQGPDGPQPLRLDEIPLPASTPAPYPRPCQQKPPAPPVPERPTAREVAS